MAGSDKAFALLAWNAQLEIKEPVAVRKSAGKGFGTIVMKFACLF
jgi:hypothetical protein